MVLYLSNTNHTLICSFQLSNVWESIQGHVANIKGEATSPSRKSGNYNSVDGPITV